MLRIERVAYRRIKELYTLDLNEDLAKEMEDNINLWLEEDYYPVEVTVQMLEDVAHEVRDPDWNRLLRFKGTTYEQTLYDYICDYFYDAIWEEKPEWLDEDTEYFEDNLVQVELPID